MDLTTAPQRAIPTLGHRLAATEGIWKLIDLNGRSIYIDFDQAVSYAPEEGTNGALSDRWEPFRYRPEVRVGSPVFFVREDRWERTTLIRSFEQVLTEAEPHILALPAEGGR